MIILDDDYFESPVMFIICGECKNYLREYKCAAFPSGIPQPILDGKNDHRTSYPGDHGIQFEAI